jgi:nucleoside-diphosphate-sugar epimerase
MKRLIFGCGYLGFPVAQRWLDCGDEVFAVTRSRERAEDFSKAGLNPLIADITEPNSLPPLPAVDSVLFAVGMDRSRYSNIRDVYVEGLKNVLARLPVETGHFIYVSSTGVYGDFDGGWVDENSPTEPQRVGGEACLEAESLIRNSPFADRATILRFAGIYGPGRVPMLESVRKRDWANLSGGGFVNLIHVADGAQVIEAVAENRPLQETFLVSDGQPVLRSHFYQKIAELSGSGTIDWSRAGDTSSRGRSDKRVSNAKLLQWREARGQPDLFQFPDYDSGLRGCWTSD